MIKFFRKFRKSLLEKGALTKYTLYAVGEILLVVIGILLALQINTYNHNNITKAKEQVYLKGLQDEFQSSLTSLAFEMKRNKNNYEGAKQLANGMIQKDNRPNETELSTLISKSFARTVQWNPKNSLLNEMISTGSMKDISNDTLRRILTAWESKLKDLQAQETLLNESRLNAVDNIRAIGSMRTVFDDTNISKNLMGINQAKNHESNSVLLESRSFENDLLIFIMTSQALERNEYNPIEKEINKILALLKKEIK